MFVVVNEPLFEGKLGRRKFLKRAGIVGATLPVAGGLVVSACSGSATPAAPSTVNPNSVKLPPPTSNATKVSTAETPEQIDAEHKKGIEDFLKNQTTPLTKGKGMVELAPRVENGVKIWDLTMDEVEWETVPGKLEKARGYNKMIPGPTLRATVGDRVRVNVKNNLTESSTIHWHGILIENKQDGVPFVTQDPIKPGASFTYEFTVPNPGSHMYHSHLNSADQVNRGLLGAFIIEPKDKTGWPAYDKEVILILNDSLLGFTINGKGFPATDAIAMKTTEKVLVRWMNEGMMYHPMHLHGGTMRVFQRDGYLMPQGQWFDCDNLDIAPGSRMDCIMTVPNPGIWAFHCHILSHAEAPNGFFGLVTAVVAQA